MLGRFALYIVEPIPEFGCGLLGASLANVLMLQQRRAGPGCGAGRGRGSFPGEWPVPGDGLSSLDDY